MGYFAVPGISWNGLAMAASSGTVAAYFVSLATVLAGEAGRLEAWGKYIVAMNFMIVPVAIAAYAIKACFVKVAISPRRSQSVEPIAHDSRALLQRPLLQQ